jgi:hypothetical protein
MFPSSGADSLRSGLLKKYWTAPGRQIETSDVLAKSKESASFLPDRSVSLTGIVFMV